MKIIFDSEEQKEKFLKEFFVDSTSCPSDIGLIEYPQDKCRVTDNICLECWLNCGIEIEVKSV